MEKIYKNKLSMFNFTKGTAFFMILTMYSLQISDFFGNNNIVLGIWFGIIFPGSASLMLATGYWFKEKEVIPFIKDMLKGAFRIYWMTGVSCILFAFLFLGFQYPELKERAWQWLAILLGFLLGRYNNGYIGKVAITEVGAMWYVLAYLLGAIFLNLLLKIRLLKEHKWLLRAVLIVLALAGLFMAPLELPFCIPHTLVATGVIYVGKCLKESEFLLRKWKITDWLLIFGSMLLVVGIYYGVIYVWGFSAFLNRVSMLGCVPFGILILRWSLYMSKKNWFVVRGIMTIGRYSLWLLILYTIETHCMDWAVVRGLSFMPKSDLIAGSIIMLIRVLLYIVGITLIIVLLNAWNRRKKAEKALPGKETLS